LVTIATKASLHARSWTDTGLIQLRDKLAQEGDFSPSLLDGLSTITSSSDGLELASFRPRRNFRFEEWSGRDTRQGRGQTVRAKTSDARERLLRWCCSADRFRTGGRNRKSRNKRLQTSLWERRSSSGPWRVFVGWMPRRRVEQTKAHRRKEVARSQSNLTEGSL
jgi:hypothetical protein